MLSICVWIDDFRYEEMTRMRDAVTECQSAGNESAHDKKVEITKSATSLNADAVAYVFYGGVSSIFISNMEEKKVRFVIQRMYAGLLYSNNCWIYSFRRDWKSARDCGGVSQPHSHPLELIIFPFSGTTTAAQLQYLCVCVCACL